MRFGILVWFYTISVFCLIGQEPRAIDGWGNNPYHPEWGATHTRLNTVVSNGYADGISQPAGMDRPNPREISNSIFGQNILTKDHMGLSDYIWSFGQFLDHDIILTDNSNEFYGIPVPSGDPMFDPGSTGSVMIPMMRSKYDETSGTDPDNPRVHMNAITSWIDGSNIYGSEDSWAEWLRTFSNGKLKTSEGNLLPYNTIDGEISGLVDPDAPTMAIEGIPIVKYFVAGDVRANEHVLLTSLHTLFVREHNRLCETLSREHPNWNDEQLYQKARAIVIGIIQAIVYNDWLPAMGIDLDEYVAFDKSADPSLSNVFTAAAYRLGHTLIGNDIMRLEESGELMAEGYLSLKDAFFNPYILPTTGGVDPYLRGMAGQMQQRLDCKMVDGLRNFLFGPPGAGGLDLAALNIQRGRERGLPDFNTIRSDLGLTTYSSFLQICSDPVLSEELENIYGGDINIIDPWVGMLAEDYMPGALFGETIMFLMKQQFGALRSGDRYFYKVNYQLTPEEIEIIDNTRLSEIIIRNTNIENIQENVFVFQDRTTLPELEPTHLSAVLFPNPTSGPFNMTIRSKVDDKARIYISNTQGKIILDSDFVLNEGLNFIDFDLSGYSQSLYFVSVEMRNRTVVKKIVKR